MTPGFNKAWIQPGGVIPIDAPTTAILVAEVMRLSDLNKANSDGWAEAVKLNWQCLAERDAAVEELNHRVDHMKNMELRVNELEAALAAPPPEEVRGLSDWLYSFAFDANCAFNEDQREHLEQVAQALERMARAQTRDAIIARLRKENAAMRAYIKRVADARSPLNDSFYRDARALLRETESP